MAGYRAVFEELPFLEEWEGLRERATWQRPRPGGGGGGFGGDVLLGLYPCNVQRGLRAPLSPGSSLLSAPPP